MTNIELCTKKESINSEILRLDMKFIEFSTIHLYVHLSCSEIVCQFIRLNENK